MPKQITRRTFIQGIAGGTMVASTWPRAVRAASPNGRLQHAAIGVGHQGRADLEAILNSGKVDVVAICDVDAEILDAAAKLVPKARKYRDWRELLDKEEKNIDSVNVATPDHMHASIAMSAIRAHKHVYCQKPLAHEINEVRQLTLAARKAHVVTQMGIQIHAHEAYRNGARLLQDGAIGKVKEWHSWCSAAGSAPGLARPAKADPVPPTLDWDLWIGAAPFRPYKADIYHPRRWRAWQDFGRGALGDFGCHIFDPVFTALGVGAPSKVWGDGQDIGDEIWPVKQTVYYEFPGTALTAGKTIRATWHDGGNQPPRALASMPADHQLPGSGSLIIGEEGAMVLPHWSEARLYPVERFKGYPRPNMGGHDHYAEWVNACMGNGTATANFDYAGPLTEAVLLGAVCSQLGGKMIEWNSAKMKWANYRRGNEYLERDYRHGWHMRKLG